MDDKKRQRLEQNSKHTLIEFEIGKWQENWGCLALNVSVPNNRGRISPEL